METIVWLGFVLVALPATGKVVVTKAGGKVSLSCGISRSNADQAWHHGSPKELIIYSFWRSGQSRKGSAAVYTRSRVTHDGSLLISPVEREDAGVFSCEVDKKSEEHTLLVVSVSSPSTFQAGSTARLQCEVDGLENSASVKWKSPNGDTHQSTHDLSPVSLSDGGTWACVFSHDSQQYNEMLVVNVKGPPTTTPQTTTQNPKNPNRPCSNCGSDAGSGQLSLWMWIVIGGGCLFVLLLLVFIIVLCKRIRRKKRMRNRQPLTPRQYCQCNRATAARKPQQGRKKGKPSALPLQPQLKE